MSSCLYLRARYYDAATGRFASRDPLPFVQRYAYVGGNPVNYVDPYGLCPVCEVLDWVGERGQDVGSVAVHTLRHPGTITNGGLVNQAIGGAIAALSSCDRRSYEGGIVVYENCGGLAARLTGGRPFTVGSFVFSTGKMEPETLKHELAHPRQYDAAGAAFLPIYAGAGALTAVPCKLDRDCVRSGKYHPIEKLADWQAGTHEY